MCEEEISRIKELFETSTSSPEDVVTEEILYSNGRISLLKKSDGTYCLRNEYMGCEHGHFLTGTDAREHWEDMVADDDI